MKDLVSGIKYDASKVINQAVGASKEFCMGYMNPGAASGEGYISTMKTVSSFCGLNGAVWGYDLATHDDIALAKESPMYWQSQPDGPDVP